jgi:hypothetical protein
MLRPCASPNCGMQVIVGRGLCMRHYQQFRNSRELDNFPVKAQVPHVIVTAKTCTKCNRELKIELFSLNATEKFPSRRKSICKECETPVKSARKKFRQSTTIGRATDLLANAKIRSVSKGLICTLTDEWIIEKLAGGCELTGFPFDLETGRSVGRFNPYGPSIDRIVAGSNYTPDNCRMVIMAINVGMNAWGEELYAKIAKAYFRHSKEKNKRVPDTTFPNHDFLLEAPPQYALTRKH